MEGKKRYVAIVLFLLIGLTLFTFANPVEEEKGSKGNGSNKPEVSDKDTTDGTLGSLENQQQNPTQVLNQVAEDTSYEDALAAVERAEASLEELDVEEARDLIEQVTNQNQKDELTERVDIVEEAIEAIKLVEELEKMVEDAEEREDILSSVDYRTDKEIIEKVEALRNEEVQESLQDRLQILSRILDDNTAPTYEGVTDGETTKEDVSITYSDTDEETNTENEVTVKVTLDGEEIDYAETFTKEGTYVVTLTDEAFNETTVTFTIDNQAPLVDKLALVGANGEWNKNKTEYKQYAKVGTTIYVNARFYEELAETPVVTLNDKVTLTKATKKQSGNVWIYSYSYTVTAEDGLVDGPLQVKVTNCKDYAGNSVELTNANATMTSQKDIIIDKTAPTYVIYKDGLRPVQNVETVELNGKLYFSDNAEIQFHDNLRLSTMIVNDGKPYTTTVGVTEQIKYVREDGEYKYTVKDRAGNALTITVVRDTKAPEVTPSYETKTVEADKNGTFTDFPTFEVKDEHNQPVEQELVSGEVDLGKLGEYELVYKFTDFLGNTTTKTVKVTVVDTTAPVVTANLDENGNKDITLEAGIDSYKELGATVTDNLDEDRQLDKPSYINHYTLDGTYTGRVAAVDTTRFGKYLLVYVTEDANKNTSNNQLLQSKRWVIVKDTINPTLTVKDESVGTDPYYSAISFALSDSNLIDYVEVNGVKLERDNAKWSDANYQNIKEHLVAGKNTIVLYDTAGNKTEKTFYMDWTAPTVTAYNWLGDNPYRGADFKLSDNYAIDYVVINGVKFDRTNAKWSDANYVNVKNALVHGENTVVLYDAAGNSAEYKYNFDRKAPTLEITKANNKVYVRGTDEADIKFNVYKGEELALEVDSKTFAGGKYFSIDWLGEGEYTIDAIDYAGNKTTATVTIDNPAVNTESAYSTQRIGRDDPRYVTTGSFFDGFMNIIYTYKFKFNEPVKLANASFTNSSGGPGFGENQNVTSDKIIGLTSNADSEGYATEFTIEYNMNSWMLMDPAIGTVYIKGDFATLSFVDKFGNTTDVTKSDGDSIALLIAR